MDPIFTLVPINTLISQLSINPHTWINNEQNLYNYAYQLTVHGLELYNELPIKLRNRIDNKFSGLKFAQLNFRSNYINQYPTAYDFIQNYYLFDTNRFVINNFMIDLISRFMLIRKYYNSHTNHDDNLLENINEIKKILKELNKEAAEDEILIDEIIKKIIEKKKSKLIDFYYTESRNTIKKLLKKLMTKKYDMNDTNDDNPLEDIFNEREINTQRYSTKQMIERIQKECNKLNKKYYKYKNKYINLKNN
jgi:hypothetical protein